MPCDCWWCLSLSRGAMGAMGQSAALRFWSYPLTIFINHMHESRSNCTTARIVHVCN